MEENRAAHTDSNAKLHYANNFELCRTMLMIELHKCIYHNTNQCLCFAKLKVCPSQPASQAIDACEWLSALNSVSQRRRRRRKTQLTKCWKVRSLIANTLWVLTFPWRSFPFGCGRGALQFSIFLRNKILVLLWFFERQRKKNCNYFKFIS